MACRLFGAEPSSESVQIYCQFDPTGHISMKFYFKIQRFHSMIYRQVSNIRHTLVGN